MTLKSSTFLGAFALLFLLAACGQSAEPIPFVEPTAESTPVEPTVEPTEEVVELVVPTEVAPTIEPTQVPPTAEPTPVIEEPIATATIEPTPEPVQLTIVEPVDAVEVMTGSMLSVNGIVDPQMAESVTIHIQMGPHTVVQATTQVDAASGEWSVDVDVPHSVEGMGRLRAMTEAETAVNDIQLVHDTAADPTGIAVNFSRPGDGDIVVAGYPLFFEGTVTGAISDTVSIGLYSDDCTTLAARYSFTLAHADASWSGLMNLPAELNGRTCAFVYTGSHGEGEWREDQMWLPSVHPHDDGIIGKIMLGNSIAEPFKAGESNYLFGSAIGAAGEELQISWMAEDGETILVEGTAVVDVLGYWETELLLPADGLGLSKIIVQLGEGEDATTLEQELTIES